MKNASYPKVKESDEQEINLKQLFEQYAFYWKWFMVSVLACFFIAFVYLRYAEQIYNVTAKILLQDEKQASGELAGLAELSALTGMGSASSAFVADQMDVMKSRRILRKVVELNRLNISYFRKGNLKSSEVLEKGSPLKLMILEPAHVRLDSVSYTFTVSKSGEIFKLKDEKGEIQEYKLGQNINTPIGPITLVPQNNNTNWDNDLTITYQPVSTTIDELLELVKISPNKDKQSFVVNFSMEHADREKAALILNSLIEQYNADVTEDKALVTRATSNFINSRLDLISKDLAEADSKVADY